MAHFPQNAIIAKNPRRSIVLYFTSFAEASNLKIVTGHVKVPEYLSIALTPGGELHPT